MCTAIHFRNRYFGRTLDFDISYGQTVAVTPRNYPFHYRYEASMAAHYAIIGMARMEGGYPLYFDAMNEKGLAVAGLNFPISAAYFPEKAGALNLCPFELIPYLLGKCASVEEVRPLLDLLNLVNAPFSPQLPLSPLHWMIADKSGAIVMESTADGIRIYEAPVGVMTNEPPYPFHLSRLADIMALTPEPPQNNFPLPLQPYSLGFGAKGLPGDWSSTSRFLRAAYTLQNAKCGDAVEAAVTQFFHILGAVSHPRGVAATAEGKLETTQYTACCDTETGVYYYTTYENSRITAVDMLRENLDGCHVVSYALTATQDIFPQN